jgi:NADH-quinone oxidoreductase subunit M
VQSVFFNALDKSENRAVQDLSRRELIILVPMIALMILIGVHPTPLLRRTEPSAQMVIDRVWEGVDLVGAAEAETTSGDEPAE